MGEGMKMKWLELFVLLCISMIGFAGDETANGSKPKQVIDQLALREVFSIAEEGLIFNRFARTDDRIFLLDSKEVVVHRFDDQGNRLGQFLSKGKGPGEFGGFPQIHVRDGLVWITAGRKIAWFDRDGNLLGEFRTPKLYPAIGIIDKNRFLAIWEDYQKGSASFTRHLSLFDLKNGKKIRDIHQAQNAGRRYAQLEKRKVSLVFGPGVVDDVIFEYDAQNRRIISSHTANYRLKMTGLDGQDLGAISRKAMAYQLSAEDKDGLADFFNPRSPEIRKAILAGIPDETAMIRRVWALAGGWLAVSHVTGVNSDRIDLFDADGVYRYAIDSALLGEYIDINFTPQGVTMAVDQDEGTIYRELAIDGLPQIWRKGKSRTE